MSTIPTATAKPNFPIDRGDDASADPFLTDEELREKSLGQLQLQKMDVNIKARKLAIMQEHKTNLELAVGMTRDRRSDTEEARMPEELPEKTPDGKAAKRRTRVVSG